LDGFTFSNYLPSVFVLQFRITKKKYKKNLFTSIQDDDNLKRSVIDHRIVVPQQDPPKVLHLILRIMRFLYWWTSLPFLTFFYWQQANKKVKKGCGVYQKFLPDINYDHYLMKNSNPVPVLQIIGKTIFNYPN